MWIDRFDDQRLNVRFGAGLLKMLSMPGFRRDKRRPFVDAATDSRDGVPPSRA